MNTNNALDQVSEHYDCGLGHWPWQWPMALAQLYAEPDAELNPQWSMRIGLEPVLPRAQGTHVDKGQLQRTQQLAPTLNNLGKQPRPGIGTWSARCPQHLPLHSSAQDAGTIAHGTKPATLESKVNASSHSTRP